MHESIQRLKFAIQSLPFSVHLNSGINQNGIVDPVH